MFWLAVPNIQISKCSDSKVWLMPEKKGIRCECHRQNTNNWNTTDFCIWVLRVEGVFVVRCFGDGILALVFCPQILVNSWFYCPFPLFYTIFGGTSIYNCAIQVFIFHTETVERCPQWTSTMRYKAIFQEYPLLHICIHIVDIYRDIKACRVGIILWRGGRIKRANMGCAA